MSANSTALKPCIVLGLETQISLGIVRELGRAGVPVIGITDEPHALALRSRYLKRGIVIEHSRSEELIRVLEELGQAHGELCLLTVSEGNLSWLLAHQKDLPHIHALIPPAQALALVLDKQHTLPIAQKLGISVPKSFQPQSMAEFETVARSIPLPAVVKWSEPNGMSEELAKHHLPLIKAEYAYKVEELIAIGQRYQSVGQWPLVQQYCVGQGLGQFFFMHKGQAVRRFQHIRIAEWPPEGGFSSVCDAVPLTEHLDLQEKSIALLQTIGWEGVAMVEYRFDPATKQAVLMEINGRFWGSFPLAVHSNACFALLAYSLQGLGQMPKLPPLRDNLRCRMVTTELKRLVRIFFQAEQIKDRMFHTSKSAELTRFIRDYFRLRVRYYVWSWDDPKPFFTDAWNLMRKTLGIK